MTEKMKSERRARVRRPLAPRYTPFQREQLRWALRCHRWKAGITWEKYPFEIRAALGMAKGDAGINDKDPKNFLLFENEPKDDKLWLFEQFIKKACPHYLLSLTENGTLSQVGDVLSNYLARDLLADGENERLQHAARFIETLLFYQSGEDALRMFGEKGCFFSFRKLGATPYLLVCSLEIDDRVLGSTGVSRFGLVDGNGFYDAMVRQRLQDVSPVESTPIRRRRMGIAVAVKSALTSDDELKSAYYIALLRDDRGEPLIVDFRFEGYLLGGTSQTFAASVERQLELEVQASYTVTPMNALCFPFRNNAISEMLSRFEWAVL